jgi:Protein of unknown function (DUF4229)
LVADADDGNEPTGRPGSRMVLDVGAYLVARLMLAALLAVVILGVGRLIAADFPLTVAVLFAIVLAFPLGIWVFAPLRRRATASIADFDERRRRDRDQLRARLRGEEPLDK